MSRGRFEKEPMSASQWTGLHCILRRYAASAMGVEGMEREREKRLGLRRDYSPCPVTGKRKGGETFLILLCLDVPGESLSWFHHGRDLCVKDLEGTFLVTFLFFFSPFSFPFNIYDLSIFAGKLTTLKRNRCIWCI